MVTKTRAGLAVIRHFEVCRLTAYPGPATGGRPYTIAYGRTAGVQPGDTCTQAQADAWLLEEYDAFEAKVLSMTNVPLKDNQLGALVCFSYNLGLANLRKSNLLALINQGHFHDAVAEFAKWNKDNGRVMAGLVSRRAEEAALFARAC